jgi:hypothetical protein
LMLKVKMFFKKIKQKQTNKQTNNFQILWKPEMQKT